MKLLWFHLMPYTQLPDDFAQRHASVWVDIDPALFDARSRTRCTTSSWTSSSTRPSSASTASA